MLHTWGTINRYSKGRRMNAFDDQLLRSLNHLADHSPLLVRLIQVIYDDDLKGAFPLALLWWAWFDAQGTAKEREVREKRLPGVKEP